MSRDDCESTPDGAPIALTVYPVAHHAFDVAWLQPGRNALGHWLEYNGRRQRSQRKRRAHSSTPISPAHLPASRRQSDPVGRPNGSDPYRRPYAVIEEGNQALESAFPSSRRVNLWLQWKQLVQALPGKAGGAAVMTTVDHTLMRGSKPHDL